MNRTEKIAVAILVVAILISGEITFLLARTYHWDSPFSFLIAVAAVLMLISASFGGIYWTRPIESKICPNFRDHVIVDLTCMRCGVTFKEWQIEPPMGVYN